MTKSPDAFRTISEAAEQLDLPQHVLRHWEDTFGYIRPMRRAGGRRFYRTYDIELLNGVKTLLHEEKYTTKGVQQIFKDNGAQYVAEIGRKALAGEPWLPEADDHSSSAAEASDAVGENVPDSITDQSADELLVRLNEMLQKLESVQDSLDEALLAVDTITAIEDR
ncbi:MAG: MerR family transcriptional regulator [Aquisalinus sp.]|nr:MerR family transcriptional regulator [Aquisalinus sp.]